MARMRTLLALINPLSRPIAVTAQMLEDALARQNNASRALLAAANGRNQSAHERLMRALDDSMSQRKAISNVRNA